MKSSLSPASRPLPHFSPLPFLSVPSPERCPEQRPDTAQGPSSRAWGLALSTYPPPLLPLTAPSFRPCTILLKLLSLSQLNTTTKPRPAKSLQDFCPTRDRLCSGEPPLQAAETWEFYWLWASPQVGDFAKRLQSLGRGCDSLIAACKVKNCTLKRLLNSPRG